MLLLLLLPPPPPPPLLLLVEPAARAVADRASADVDGFGNDEASGELGTTAADSVYVRALVGASRSCCSCCSVDVDVHVDAAAALATSAPAVGLAVTTGGAVLAAAEPTRAGALFGSLTAVLCASEAAVVSLGAVRDASVAVAASARRGAQIVSASTAGASAACSCRGDAYATLQGVYSKKKKKKTNKQTKREESEREAGVCECARVRVCAQAHVNAASSRRGRTQTPAHNKATAPHTAARPQTHFTHSLQLVGGQALQKLGVARVQRRIARQQRIAIERAQQHHMRLARFAIDKHNWI
jgi:hypothetical protein